MSFPCFELLTTEHLNTEFRVLECGVLYALYNMGTMCVSVSITVHLFSAAGNVCCP